MKRKISAVLSILLLLTPFPAAARFIPEDPWLDGTIDYATPPVGVQSAQPDTEPLILEVNLSMAEVPPYKRFTLERIFLREDLRTPRTDQEAAKWLQEAADKGMAKAQFILSQLYVHGRGVPKDQNKAKEWLGKAAVQLAKTSPYWDRPQEVSEIIEGMEAFEEKDYESALVTFRPAAERGNRQAQFYLGKMYEEGKGVPKNIATAVQWYQKSATQGRDAAQYHLGELYAQGLGVAKDTRQAEKWLLRAANQGSLYTAYGLAEIYAQGKLLPQNYRKAEKWLDRYGELGGPEVWYRVAESYGADGNDNMLKNPEKAEKWLLRWVKGRGLRDQFHLGKMYGSGKMGARNLKKAEKLLSYVAEKGNATAKAQVAILYAQGEVLPRNLDKAQMLLEQSVDPKNIETLYRMGNIYLYGQYNFEKNPRKAAEWFQRAADSEYGAAQTKLALLYLQGRGVPQDTEKALADLHKLTERGWAVYTLGSLYYFGQGVPQDYSKAQEWFRKAVVRSKDDDAAYCLGVMYELGQGVPKDIYKANLWYGESYKLRYGEGVYRIQYAKETAPQPNRESSAECVNVLPQD